MAKKTPAKKPSVKPIMCEKTDKREEMRKFIEKARTDIKKARLSADDLHKNLCDANWIGKYKGDGIVILAYSNAVRKLRNESRELEKSIIFLENRLEVTHIETAFDEKIVEKLKKLNTIVESHIESTLT